MELEQWDRMGVGRTESPTQWFNSKGCGVNGSGQESTSNGSLLRVGRGGSRWLSTGTDSWHLGSSHSWLSFLPTISLPWSKSHHCSMPESPNSVKWCSCGLNALWCLFWLQQLSSVRDLDRAVSLHGDSKFSLVDLTQTQPLEHLSDALCKHGLFMKRTRKAGMEAGFMPRECNSADTFLYSCVIWWELYLPGSSSRVFGTVELKSI